MKLEQVLPMLRDGKTITRTKTLKHDGATIVFVKIEESRLKFRVIWSDGEAMRDWSSYRLRAEDVLAENWEIAG
jgi:hypothetical protein